MRYRVVPYKRGSSSAKILAEQLSNRLGYKVFRGLPKLNRRNIYFGFSKSQLYRENLDVNNPAAIKLAKNKRETFKKINATCAIPQYTTNKEEAAGWLSEGKTVVARLTVTGQGGSGIRIVTPADTLPDAPLYTQYIKKKKEFRVHVVGNEAILVYEKRKKRGWTAHDPLIRSHLRGWVFCKNNVVEPEGLRELAVAAVKALGLTFGGVDIIWNKLQNRCYVLEVNSAPGLAPSSGEVYAAHLLNA